MRIIFSTILFLLSIGLFAQIDNATPDKAILEYYNLQSETQNSILYKPSSQYIESITSYFAYKWCDNKDAASDMFLAGFSSTHKISPIFRIYFDYNYAQQDLIWGNHNQHHLYVNAAYNIKNAWKLQVGVNHILYDREIDYVSISKSFYNREINNHVGIVNVEDEITNKSTWEGALKQKCTSLHFSIQKSINNFKIRPQISWIIEKLSPNQYQTVIESSFSIHKQFGKVIKQDNVILSDNKYHYIEDCNNYYWQGGFDLSYFYRFSQYSKIGIGVENLFTNEGNSKYFFRPYVFGNIGNFFEYVFWALRKESTPLSYMNGAIMYNSHDTYKYLLASAFGFNINKHISISANFIYSTAKDKFSEKNYNSIMSVLGLKYLF